MKRGKNTHSEARMPCLHQASVCVVSVIGTFSSVIVKGDNGTFIGILLRFQGLIDVNCSGQFLELSTQER